MIISKQFTNRDNKSLDQYFQEISKIDLLTADEEIDLAILIKKGDEVAQEKLIKANLRFVISVAKQFQSQGLSLGDLINEGNIGLIKAAQRFDVTRGFKFISYAVWWVRQGIMQAIADHQRVVRLPLNRVSLLTKISKASKALEQEYERKPSTEELAHYLDITTNEVSSTLQTSGRQLSIDAPLAMGSESNHSLLDVIPDNKNTLPDKELMQESLRNEVENILAKLAEREAEVIKLSYGIGYEKSATLEEIGKQFNLTRERIRQIKEKALRKLRISKRSNQLRKFLG
ncbi:MAG: RNA polymerase sigma factor RpoD/SigA [Ignavibacteriaceae bacterium]|jgi:RNA polymerase primary sigma factor